MREAGEIVAASAENRGRKQRKCQKQGKSWPLEQKIEEESNGNARSRGDRGRE